MKYYNNFAVDVYTKEGRFMGNWPTAVEAAKALKVKNLGNIYNCLNGTAKSSDGYIWKYNPTEVIMLDGEVWKPIPEFETTYMISNKGRVAALSKKGKPTFNILKAVSGNRRYLTVTLTNSDNKLITKAVHRLVAEVFIPNPDKKSQIDHIDTNTFNNCVENLRWVTCSENNRNPLTIQHHISAGFKNNLSGIRKANQSKKVSIMQIIDSNTFLYDSYCDAAIKTGHNTGVIYKWCKKELHGWSIIK